MDNDTRNLLYARATKTINKQPTPLDLSFVLREINVTYGTRRRQSRVSPFWGYGTLSILIYELPDSNSVCPSLLDTKQIMFRVTVSSVVHPDPRKNQVRRRWQLFPLNPGDLCDAQQACTLLVVRDIFQVIMRWEGRNLNLLLFICAARPSLPSLVRRVNQPASFVRSIFPQTTRNIINVRTLIRPQTCFVQWVQRIEITPTNSGFAH